MSKLSKIVAEALGNELNELDIFLHSWVIEERLAREAIKALRNFDSSEFTFSEAEAIRRMIDSALEGLPD